MVSPWSKLFVAVVVVLGAPKFLKFVAVVVVLGAPAPWANHLFGEILYRRTSKVL